MHDDYRESLQQYFNLIQANKFAIRQLNSQSKYFQKEFNMNKKVFKTGESVSPEFLNSLQDQFIAVRFDKL